MCAMSHISIRGRYAVMCFVHSYYSTKEASAPPFESVSPVGLLIIFGSFVRAASVSSHAIMVENVHPCGFRGLGLILFPH